MKQRTWQQYAFWVLLAEAAGALAGWLTREGTAQYAAAAEKPPLSPPAVVFPIVWSILYALMGIGAARIFTAPRSMSRTRALRVFFLQLVFNFFWSVLFFNLQNYGLALLWLAVLWVLVLWMILVFRKVDPPAAVMQIPYFLWVSFAALLNYGVWTLNA